MYDFTSLSPHEFEELSCDLLSAKEGVHFQTYAEGKDKGIDFRYHSPPDEWIGQCKHVPKSRVTSLLKKLEMEELPKVQRLKPTKYFLTTSISLLPQHIDKIFALFSPFCKSKGDIYGREQLNDLLRRYPTVQERHHKLWLTNTAIVSRLLNNGLITNRFLTEDQIKASTQLWVYTNDYRRAFQQLENNRVCILTGIPGVGKTTLAYMMAAYFANKEWDFIVGDQNVSELLQLVNHSPDKPQILLYDDFLGVTSLEDTLGHNEVVPLIRLIEHVANSENKRFILTTREYILVKAKQTYERLSDGRLDVFKFVVECNGYSYLEKGKIFANHLYFNEVPQSHITALIKERNYRRIVSHKNYSPRIISAITSPKLFNEHSAKDYCEYILSQLDNPKEIWDHPFRNQLTTASKQLVLCLVSCNNAAEIGAFRKVFNQTYLASAKKHNFPTTPDDFDKAREQLRDTFIVEESIAGFQSISIHNPSIVDFAGNYLRTTASYSEDLLSSAMYFEQVQRLTLALAAGSWTNADNFNSLNPDLPIAEAYERTFFVQPLDRIVSENVPGKPPRLSRYSALPDYPGRLLFGIHLAQGSLRDKMIPVMLRVFEQVMPRHVFCGASSISAILEVLKLMKQEQWYGSGHANSYATILTDFATVQGAYSHEYYDLMIWIRANSACFPDEKIDSWKKTVRNEIEMKADEEKYGADLQELEGIFGIMTEIWDWADTPHTKRQTLFDDLTDRINEREREKEEDSIRQPVPLPPIAYPNENEDEIQVDAIFKGLRQ